MAKPKPWWKSKTLYVSALQVVAGVLAVPGLGVPAGTVLIASGVVHAVLRVLTSQPVAAGK